MSTFMTSTGPMERMWTSPLAYGRHAAAPLETTMSKSVDFVAARAVPAVSNEPASSVAPIPSLSVRFLNQPMAELLERVNYALGTAGSPLRLARLGWLGCQNARLCAT